RARVGRIVTPHGVIDTPCFVPVGTNGALKGVSSEQAREAGVQLMFCNTYHLLVHPGPEVVDKAGGLHKFISHPATMPIITDSGGFQVFSLGEFFFFFVARYYYTPQLWRLPSVLAR
ncbi:tRNA-guanine(15) transglycosylase-like protein, partial [Pavlovales sp. CCMP2436]